MKRNRYYGEIRNPHGAMENAKALLLVVNHLDADTDKEPIESPLFRGLIIVVPTLNPFLPRFARVAVLPR